MKIFDFPADAFSFCFELFCIRKKWDCSLYCWLPSLRSGSLRACALVSTPVGDAISFLNENGVINPMQKASIS
ncbi:MAG: hypothetical protein IKC94_05055, partial [Lentisphaeria bacterium]|nr:hypothetical protein [Lentisphaeria bacterium]